MPIHWHIMRWTAARTRRAFEQWGGWVALAVGAVLCVLGWYGISGERFAERQLPYLASSTIPGAALIVAGAVLIGRAPEPRAEQPDEPPGNGAPDRPVAVSTDPPVAVPGGTLFHRPDCPLAEGKPGLVAAAADADLRPCPVCEPES